jgi:hypothetical protein
VRKEIVEIYSDQTNAAIMRHPGRTFPGVLIQGDSLSALCKEADALCEALGRTSPVYLEANGLRNQLRSHLTHYKLVLTEHAIPLPFSDG